MIIGLILSLLASAFWNSVLLVLIMRCIYVDVNIALGKPVSVSSSRHWDPFSGPASVIVDGNRYERFVHTRYENRAWFKIDLLKEVLFLFLNCATCTGSAWMCPRHFHVLLDHSL